LSTPPSAAASDNYVASQQQRLANSIGDDEQGSSVQQQQQTGHDRHTLRNPVNHSADQQRQHQQHQLSAQIKELGSLILQVGIFQRANMLA
jgi:hypothetical protein